MADSRFRGANWRAAAEADTKVVGDRCPQPRRVQEHQMETDVIEAGDGDKGTRGRMWEILGAVT
jgi:hypothetical protein